MKFLKVKVHENCQMLAVVDDADNILTAAAFTSDQDTEAAEDFAYTLLVNTGLMKAPADMTRPKTVDELLGIIETACGDSKSYIKDLAIEQLTE